MTQSQLHHLLTLHCHKDRTDSLSLTECLQEFADCRNRRNDVFGKFKYTFCRHGLLQQLATYTVEYVK